MKFLLVHQHQLPTESDNFFLDPNFVCIEPGEVLKCCPINPRQEFSIIVDNCQILDIETAKNKDTLSNKLYFW